MKRMLVLSAAFALLGAGGGMADGVSALPPVAIPMPAMPDEQVKTIIVALCSVYPQACACPNHKAINGSLCGKRSARTLRGGWKPLCTESDVTPRMIEAYRRTGSAAAACDLVEQD